MVRKAATGRQDILCKRCREYETCIRLTNAYVVCCDIWKQGKDLYSDTITEVKQTTHFKRRKVPVWWREKNE